MTERFQKMTNLHILKIKSAILDCEAFIQREEKRNPSLRPNETQKLLDWYRGHLLKLNTLLNECSNQN